MKCTKTLTEHGLIVRFNSVKKEKMEAPSFCDGHPGVEFMRSIGEHLEINQIGPVLGRRFYSNGKMFANRDEAIAEIEEALHELC